MWGGDRHQVTSKLCSLSGRIAVWHSCPAAGFVTLMECGGRPPRYWVIACSGSPSELDTLLNDPRWIEATPDATLPARHEMQERPQLGEPARRPTPWRRVVRVPSSALSDPEAVARFATGSEAGMYRNPALWIDLPQVTPEALRQIETVEHECLRLQEAGIGVTTGMPIVLVHGALERCNHGALTQFAEHSNRAFIAAILAEDAAGSRTAVRALADAGAVVPVELRITTQDRDTFLESCAEWTEINRLAGLLVTPALRKGLGVDPAEFAVLLLRLYDAELLPSSRLFPVNVVLAALSGSHLPTTFAADPLSGMADRLCAATRVAATAAKEHEGAFARLLQVWEHYGIMLPPTDSLAFAWLERMAGALYRHLITQLAQKLVNSIEEPAKNGEPPRRWRATFSQGKLTVDSCELAPAQTFRFNGNNHHLRFPNAENPAKAAARRASLIRNCGGPPRTAAWSYLGRRCYHPQSLPRHMAINVIDLDVTKQCNLCCVYCFKSGTVHPRAERMSLEVAQAAVDWLIDASMGAKQLWVHLMGGEPLLAWKMVEQLVPYAKLKAATFGAGVQFGVTTNLTLVNQAILDFSRRWGMGWHCSIDGIPEMQNAQRPRAGGGPSALAAERGAKLILSYRPTACARATVTPPFVGKLYESVLYFESLGFVHFGFAMADEPSWTDRELEEYDRQWSLIADHVIHRFRQGQRLMASAFDWIIEKFVAGVERQHSCGAGRGSVMVDYNGDLWPCHRWDGADLDSGGRRQWRMGNIFQPGFNDKLHLALLDRDRSMTRQLACDDCPLERLCAGGCPAANLQLTGNIYRIHDTLTSERNSTFLKAFYGEEKPRIGIVTSERA
jgi:uncharacterized protein